MFECCTDSPWHISRRLQPSSLARLRGGRLVRTAQPAPWVPLAERVQPAASGPSTLNEDQIAERGCAASEMVLDQCGQATRDSSLSNHRSHQRIQRLHLFG